MITNELEITITPDHSLHKAVIFFLSREGKVTQEKRVTSDLR